MKLRARGGAPATGGEDGQRGSGAGRWPQAVPGLPGGWGESLVSLPRTRLCGVCSPRSPAPTNPALFAPGTLLPGPAQRGLQPAACGRVARSGRGPPPSPAGSPAPRSGPYVTDFEFPDCGTREVGRPLCPTLSLLGVGDFPLPLSLRGLCPSPIPACSFPLFPVCLTSGLCSPVPSWPCPLPLP